jgi:hypothetical protein
LSGLSLIGRIKPKIDAWLNPQAFVIAGVQLGDKDVREVLKFALELSEAITEVGDLAKSSLVQRAAYDRKTKATVPADASFSAKTHWHLIEVQPGARGPDVQKAFKEDPRARPGVVNIVRYVDRESGYQQDVRRGQGGRYGKRDKVTGESKIQGDYPENQVIHMEHPTTGEMTPLSYGELVEKIQQFSPAEQRQIAAEVIGRLGGVTPKGPHTAVVDQLNTWLVQQETRRNTSAFITSVIAFDSVASGVTNGPTLVKVAEGLPMRDVGAQAKATKLNEALRDPDNRKFGGSRQLALQQISAIDNWLLALEIITSSENDIDKILRLFYNNVQARMFEIHRLTPSEIRYVRKKVQVPR